MIGQTVSHYEFVERLGGGGMGVVYKCRDTRLDRLVALKFLAPAFAESEPAKERFISEAKAASALDHPNIGTIHEIDETPDGTLFIVMSYYPGRALNHILDRGRLPPERVVEITSQVAGGLARAHEKGIVHRDIKPGNILTTDRNEVKIVDFGLAKFSDIRLTDPGQTLGTPAYMSPEQARGETVDHRADIWALGVVMYEMLTGVLPFKGNDGPSVLEAILEDEPPSMGFLGEGASRIEPIVKRALSKDPAGRYPSALDLLSDLERLALEAGPKSGAGIDDGASLGESSTKIRADDRSRGIHRSGERRQATALSCELLEFSSLAEVLDPEDLGALMRRYRELAAQIVERYEGHVAQPADDRLTCYFGYPRAHEDDARRAVAAGLELLAASPRLNDFVQSELGQPLEPPIRLRVGIHTGRVVAEERSSGQARADSAPIVGAVSSMAAKVSRAAGPEQVLITRGNATSGRRFFRDHRARANRPRRLGETGRAVSRRGRDRRRPPRVLLHLSGRARRPSARARTALGPLVEGARGTGPGRLPDRGGRDREVLRGSGAQRALGEEASQLARGAMFSL